jgi:hypothetical protein
VSKIKRSKVGQSGRAGGFKEGLHMGKESRESRESRRNGSGAEDKVLDLFGRE